MSTIKWRKKLRVALGDGTFQTLRSQNANESKERSVDYSPLTQAVRSHANFAEYVPFAIVLLGSIELNGGNRMFLHALNIVLTLSRVIHVEQGMKEKRSLGIGRVLGMIGTISVMVIAAVSNIYLSAQSLFL